MKNNSLQSCNIVVTRPVEQAQGLTQLIEEAGGNAVLLPLLKISESENKSDLDKLIQDLSQYSILIFISPNAVKFGLTYILERAQIPENCKIASVGKGSASAAKKLLNHEIDIVPKAFDGQSGGYNSEALLALPAMLSVKNKQIAILRGNGGREVLADTLRERGAQVSYINTYTRSVPDDENSQSRLDTVKSLINNKKKLCITISSGESLKNLVSLLECCTPAWLNTVQLIVINQRLVTIAKQLGFKKEPLIAKNASDQALFDCAMSWNSLIK